MSNCGKCEYLKVTERQYFDSNNVRRTDVRYICSLTGEEKKLTDSCEGYNERKTN